MLINKRLIVLNPTITSFFLINITFILHFQRFFNRNICIFLMLSETDDDDFEKNGIELNFSDDGNANNSGDGL